jgi:hypothetical protein
MLTLYRRSSLSIKSKAMRSREKCQGHKYMKKYLIILTCLTLSGCGTFSNGGKQTVFIQTIIENKITDNAACIVKNRSGTWNVNSSADVTIDRSAGDLEVTCKSNDDLYEGREIISSKTNSSMWASIVTIGAASVLDAASSAGFDYPNNIMIIMKKRPIEEKIK